MSVTTKHQRSYTAAVEARRLRRKLLAQGPQEVNFICGPGGRCAQVLKALVYMASAHVYTSFFARIGAGPCHDELPEPARCPACGRRVDLHGALLQHDRARGDAE